MRSPGFAPLISLARSACQACTGLAILGLVATLCAQVPKPASPQATDRIKLEVAYQLITLPYYDVFSDIEFTLTGRKVTLSGHVTTAGLKEAAQNAAMQVRGVEEVVNHLQVLPTSNFDYGLRIALRRAIYDYPALEKYDLPIIPPIHIIVENRRVTLEGVVDSAADKKLVEQRAHTVSGVISMTNRLVVEKGQWTHGTPESNLLPAFPRRSALAQQASLS